MSEPTREQLIQQANLRADYLEAETRGENWEEWQFRQWNSSQWQNIDRHADPFFDTLNCEYRRTPEPPRPIVKTITGHITANGFIRDGNNQHYMIAGLLLPRPEEYVDQQAVLSFTIYPDDLVHAKRYVSMPTEVRDALDELTKAVKGGAE